ncbi:MAG: uracil-DNA glycosylase family protein, partial [Gallionella sp.]
MPKLVGGSGPIDSKIVFVGEAPGAEEDRLGVPFVGVSGELLTSIIHGLGLAREDIYITNVVKERPKDNKIEQFIKFDKGRTLVTEAYTKYENFLYEELSHTKANVYVAIGGVALWALCRQDKISKRRGSILQGHWPPQGGKVVPIIHPASALRNYIFTHFIRFDLRRAIEESAYPDIRLPSRRLHIEPSFIEAMAYLQSCYNRPKLGFDIEVVNEEISCISIARTPYDCMSIPFVMEGRDYFTIDQEIAIWQEIANILETPSIEKVGHNVCFDSTFIFIKYGIRSVNLKDSMVSSSICYPDFPKGLDFVTSICTREPYYKDDG